ncbi:unnamed protein product [Dicrocoelium dendriticum]|nr:unnamed protein product [Dicrocoelium dendriticum]
MPPKPSKTKKKREEEERLRLEEEAQLRAEEESKLRQLKEREEKKQRKLTEKKELKLRKLELAETRELLQEHRIRLEQLESERRAEYAWKRYFRCDGSPNPSIEKEVNTFMSLWRLDESRLTMEEVMNDSVHSLKLIDELRTLVADIGDNEEDAQTLATYRRTMHELRQLVHEKLDRATVETLSRATHYADHETSNLQKIWRNDWISICIWANLSKNPRVRQFTFPDVDITFDIPKFLTLSDCSFLISFMKFDNYSVECSSYTPKKTNPVSNKELDDQMKKPPAEQPAGEIVEPTLTEDIQVDLFSEFTRISAVEETEEPTAEADEITDPPPEDLIPTPEPDQWERAKLCPDAVDLGEYHVIGGVIRFDLLTLPRQPRSGRGWSITTCVRPPILAPFEYNVDPVQKISQHSVGSESQEKKEEKKEEKPPVQVKFRLPMCLVIAEDPLLARWDPEVNQWRTSGIELEEFKEDENLIVLRTSVFGTMAIFQDSHINMPFQPVEASTVEISKDNIHNEPPEKDMILGPVPTLGISDEAYLSELPDTNQCILTITGGLTELRLHILGERIAVLPGLPEQGEFSEPVDTAGSDSDGMPDIPNYHRHELTHLHGRWFTSDELITVLQLSGVNIFPREDSVCRVECLDKNPIVEQRLYEQMALLSPSFAFACSRWNAECGDRNTIIITAVEHVDNEHSIDEEAWRVYAMTRKKVTRLRVKEYDETFDPKVDQKQPFHADLYHMFMDTGSEDAKRRVRKIDLKYFKTVRQILQATRLAVFT